MLLKCKYCNDDANEPNFRTIEKNVSPCDSKYIISDDEKVAEEH